MRPVIETACLRERWTSPGAGSVPRLSSRSRTSFTQTHTMPQRSTGSTLKSELIRLLSLNNSIRFIKVFNFFNCFLLITMLSQSREYKFRLTLEMFTGMPLGVSAQLQINMLVRHVPGMRFVSHHCINNFNIYPLNRYGQPVWNSIRSFFLLELHGARSFFLTGYHPPVTYTPAVALES